MIICLPDVNLLLAQADAMHLHHEAIHVWFAHGDSQAWVPCPINENGFVRASGEPTL